MKPPPTTGSGSLINPEPLDQAAIDGLMTKRPYLRWYELRALIQWRRAQRRWQKERGLA